MPVLQNITIARNQAVNGQRLEQLADDALKQYRFTAEGTVYSNSNFLSKAWQAILDLFCNDTVAKSTKVYARAFNEYLSDKNSLMRRGALTPEQVVHLNAERESILFLQRYFQAKGNPFIESLRRDAEFARCMAEFQHEPVIQLDNQLAAANAQVAALQEQLQQLRNAPAAAQALQLQQQLAAAQAQLQPVQQQLAAANEQLRLARAAPAAPNPALQQRVDAAELRAAAAEAQVAGLREQVAQAQAGQPVDVAQVQQRLVQEQGRAGQLQAQRDGLQQQVLQLQQQLRARPVPAAAPVVPPDVELLQAQVEGIPQLQAQVDQFRDQAGNAQALQIQVDQLNGEVIAPLRADLEARGIELAEARGRIEDLNIAIDDRDAVYQQVLQNAVQFQIDRLIQDMEVVHAGQVDQLNRGIAHLQERLREAQAAVPVDADHPVQDHPAEVVEQPAPAPIVDAAERRRLQAEALAARLAAQMGDAMIQPVPAVPAPVRAVPAPAAGQPPVDAAEQRRLRREAMAQAAAQRLAAAQAAADQPAQLPDPAVGQQPNQPVQDPAAQPARVGEPQLPLHLPADQPPAQDAAPAVPANQPAQAGEPQAQAQDGPADAPAAPEVDPRAAARRAAADRLANLGRRQAQPEQAQQPAAV